MQIHEHDNLRAAITTHGFTRNTKHKKDIINFV